MYVQIVDTSSGKILGSNEVGEMWFRGPQIMKGYLNKPEATRQTVDADGWLHTGKFAYNYMNKWLYRSKGDITLIIRHRVGLGCKTKPTKLQAINFK